MHHTSYKKNNHTIIPFKPRYRTNNIFPIYYHLFIIMENYIFNYSVSQNKQLTNKYIQQVFIFNYISQISEHLLSSLT